MSATNTPVKKDGAAAAEARTFNVDDVVLGKLKGYPQWPAKIMNPDDVPSNVLDERPNGKRHYCVRFFPAGDHAWLSPRDITLLPEADIRKFLDTPKGAKRSGDLVQGYRVALDWRKWEEEMASGSAQQDEPEEEDDEDAMDEDGSASTRKRKKSIGGAKKDTPAKKRKTASTGGGGAAAKKAAKDEDDAKPDEPGGKKRKEKKEEDDEKFAHLKTDPGAVNIKSLRHQLQKTFLNANGPPTDKDVEQGDALFKQLEADDVPIEYLTYSKIGKVMRHIASLEDGAIPREAEFGFRSRAGSLVSKWHRMADPGPTRTAPRPSTGAPAPAPVSAGAEPGIVPAPVPELAPANGHAE